MKYNNRKYNHLVLQNYIYIALFESKCAVYYAERMASSIENILEVLQFVFLRDIKEDKYAKYLHEIVLIGTYVYAKSASFSKKSINYSFTKTKQEELCNEMLLEFSIIKHHEVSHVVSTSMSDFKYKYTSLIDKYSYSIY